MKVGLIGFGQIGRAVAAAIGSGQAGDGQLVAVLVRDRSRVQETLDGVLVTTHPTELFASDAQVIVDVAGHAALRQYVAGVLESGKDLMTVSVGAFADPSFLETVEDLTRRTGQRVLIPSGAIAGLDMISAAALGPLERVIHTTRKHPRAFTVEQVGLREPTEELLLFDGPAREGVGRFPENVNVAAAVSMAGIGLDRTRLRVFADPAVRRNIHEVEVSGYFGTLHIKVQNEPSEKPNTGRIVALSVTKALRNLSAPIVLGL